MNPFKILNIDGKASKKEIIEASEKFLSILLDVMDKEFWPDWEKANSNE